MITLAESLRKFENAKFEYGVLDCCLFVADVLRDTTGKDYAQKYRGQYTGEFGAIKTIMKHGSFINLMCSVLGDPRPFWVVRPGDPVLLRPETVVQDAIGNGIGIFDGDQIVYLTECGLARAPLSAARGCWNV